MSIGEKIRNEVESSGGINKVAIASDVSKTQIYSVMRNEKYNIETLRRLCAYFGLTLKLES